MSDARRRAEEALRYNRTHANSPRVRAALVEALEALLASEPAKVSGSVSIVRSDDPPAAPLPTCANCGSNLIEPAPAHDAKAAAPEGEKEGERG